jgi:hypothetical protein
MNYMSKRKTKLMNKVEPSGAMLEAEARKVLPPARSTDATRYKVVIGKAIDLDVVAERSEPMKQRSMEEDYYILTFDKEWHGLIGMYEDEWPFWKLSSIQR